MSNDVNSVVFVGWFDGFVLFVERVFCKSIDEVVFKEFIEFGIGVFGVFVL